MLRKYVQDRLKTNDDPTAAVEQHLRGNAAWVVGSVIPQQIEAFKKWMGEAVRAHKLEQEALANAERLRKLQLEEAKRMEKMRMQEEEDRRRRLERERELQQQRERAERERREYEERERRLREQRRRESLIGQVVMTNIGPAVIVGVRDGELDVQPLGFGGGFGYGGFGYGGFFSM